MMKRMFILIVLITVCLAVYFDFNSRNSNVEDFVPPKIVKRAITASDVPVAPGRDSESAAGRFISGATPGRENESSRKSPSDDSLASLYEVLHDDSKIDEWNAATLRIAAHGTSEESSSAILDYIRRPVPENLSPGAIEGLCFSKIEAVKLLGFMGGEQANRVLTEIFLSEDRNISISENWMPKLNQLLQNSEEEWYHLNNLVRARAALGMLISGNPDLENVVVEYFADLKQRFNSPRFSEAEENLFWVLVGAQAANDALKKVGRNALLIQFPKNNKTLAEMQKIERLKYYPKFN